jgi:pimeloyl-ACP methyl ester carboxylesterase
MTWKSKAARIGTRTVLALTLSATVSSTINAQTPANPWGGQKGPGQYADVNGIKLYYELHGQSRDGSLPLVLLHGGLGAGSMFGANLTALAKGRQVILVDLQGHGRTADIDRPMTLEAMSDDIVALLGRLHVAQADVMGYSLGGGVALQTAVRHPELVRRLVIVSTVIRSNAYYQEMRAQQVMVNASIAETMKQTPMYQLYSSVAPRPQDFPRLLDKIGALMKTDFDYSSQVAGLKPLTLIVAGDADMFPIAHAAEVFALLDGGKRDGGWDGSGRSKRAQLAILPGQTHYTTFSAPSLVAVAIPFLDAK